MNLRIDELISTLLTVRHQTELVSAITQFTQCLEFEYFAYGVCITTHVTRPTFRLLNNYPQAWQAQYGQCGYLACDPTVQHCLVSSKPIIWEESVFAYARDFWEDAKNHGICSGWAQSMQLSRVARGMFTLARSNEYLGPRELSQKQRAMVSLNQAAQAGFQQFLLPHVLPAAREALTQREIEILKWCAEGKTSQEISLILTITERTVNFHMANVLQKLDVCNKTAAVLRAYQLGLI